MPDLCLRMILSENRVTLFGIMRQVGAGKASGASLSIPHSANASHFPQFGIAA
jgi:hypothetical protein